MTDSPNRMDKMQLTNRSTVLRKCPLLGCRSTLKWRFYVLNVHGSILRFTLE